MNLIIIKKLLKPYKRISDWVDANKLEWSLLSKNPNAVDMFKGNEDKLLMNKVVKLETAIAFVESNIHLLNEECWINLNANPKAINILLKHPDKINIKKLCKNPNGINIIKGYKNIINNNNLDLFKLHMNPSAIEILNNHYDSNTNNCFIIEPYMELMLGNPNLLKINIMNDNLEFLLDMDMNISYLFKNNNYELKNIMLQNVSRAVYQNNFKSLSSCIYVEEIYTTVLNIFDIYGNLIDKENEYMIDWIEISKNKHALKLIEKNLDKIDWMYLSQNPCAIDILKNNIEKINWKSLSLNPDIFEESYELYIKYYTSIIDIIME